MHLLSQKISGKINYSSLADPLFSMIYICVPLFESDDDENVGKSKKSMHNLTSNMHCKMPFWVIFIPEDIPYARNDKVHSNFIKFCRGYLLKCS